MRVGVNCHNERCRHGCKGCVQCVVFALLGLENTPVVESKAITRRVGKERGVVGRVVVRDDDLNPTCICGLGDVFERADDRLALVPRRHEDRHRRPLAFGPVALGRIEREFLVARDQEREDHEADHQARDVGEEDRDHPAHDGADRSLKLTSPWLGDPDAERHPRERQCEGDREADRGPQARGRSIAPRTTTESLAWRADDRISFGDRDLIIDRGQLRRGSSWAASSKRTFGMQEASPPDAPVAREQAQRPSASRGGGVACSPLTGRGTSADHSRVGWCVSGYR